MRRTRIPDLRAAGRELSEETLTERLPALRARTAAHAETPD